MSADKRDPADAWVVRYEGPTETTVRIRITRLDGSVEVRTVVIGDNTVSTIGVRSVEILKGGEL